jgi:hypothetical protein
MRSLLIICTTGEADIQRPITAEDDSITQLSQESNTDNNDTQTQSEVNYQVSNISKS